MQSIAILRVSHCRTDNVELQTKPFLGNFVTTFLLGSLDWVPLSSIPILPTSSPQGNGSCWMWGTHNRGRSLMGVGSGRDWQDSRHWWSALRNLLEAVAHVRALAGDNLYQMEESGDYSPTFHDEYSEVAT